jgi:RimJ/RimL family protein N-acetyltransferase
MAKAPHSIRIDGRLIETPTLTMRPWQPSDAEQAISIFGTEEVTRWLAPSMDRITDVEAMRSQLDNWINSPEPPPVGYWAVVDRESDQLVGSGQIIPMPPENRDLLIGFQVLPSQWGSGFGTDVGHALAHYAFENGLDEIFAVVRTRNARAQSVTERIGMEWVGETEKYFGLRLHVYRLRQGDLDRDPLDTGIVP